MRKALFLIGVIMLLITVYEISNSYAKYVANASAIDEATAGAWVIKVNDSDISSASSQRTFTIDNLTYEESEYVVEGKLAPSARGYFDITIDPSGSSVAVRFDVSIDSTEMEINDSIKIDSAYKVVNDVEIANSIVETQAGPYAGTISLSEVQNDTLVTARFYIVWEEDENTSDEDDSIIGTHKDQDFNLPITVVVSQYSGETIT